MYKFLLRRLIGLAGFSILWILVALLLPGNQDSKEENYDDFNPGSGSWIGFDPDSGLYDPFFLADQPSIIRDQYNKTFFYKKYGNTFNGFRSFCDALKQIFLQLSNLFWSRCYKTFFWRKSRWWKKFALLSNPALKRKNDAIFMQSYTLNMFFYF